MTVELWAALFASTAVSGVLFMVNAELLVVGTAAVLPTVAVPAVATVAAVGQMTTKTVLYGLARWAPSRLPEKATAQLDRMCEALSRYDGYVGLIIFASASVGVPPFYGVSIAAGALRVRLSTFLVLGVLGRALRFGVLAWGSNQAGETLREAAVLGWLPGLG